MFEMTEQMADLVRLQRTWLKNKGLQGTAAGYFESCERDLKDVLSKFYRPEKFHALDIGCGMAGADVLLYQYFHAVHPVFYLLDVNQVDAAVQYGYRNQISAYCDFAMARKFAALNGIPRQRFFFIETWPETAFKFDLILSLISCGFHYPVDLYLAKIVDSLAPSGRVILDIRKNSGQFETLHRVFDRVDVVRVEEKYKRVVCWNG
jgi:SAM-dependent methyltransferase